MLEGSLQPRVTYSEIRHQLDNARWRASRLGRELRQLAIEQPVVSAFVAFGCGFVVARIFSRF